MKFKVNDKVIGTNGEIGVITKIESEECEIKWLSDEYISNIPTIFIKKYFRAFDKNSDEK